MEKPKDPRVVVLMLQDYTTESHNLGKRTYTEGEPYQVCPLMLKELTESGAGKQVDPKKHQPSGVVIREHVEIIPKVTRWISANGADEHRLVEGKRLSVPSNLAAYLLTHNFAEAA